MAQNDGTPTARSLPEGGKARRVYLQLQEDIQRGVYAVGDILPGEHKLAETLDVSRVTVRRAMDALARDGLIDRRAGAGTRVREPRPHPSMAADFTTLMPQLFETGQDSTARLLSLSYGTAPGPVNEAMGQEAATRMQVAVRLRLLDNVPLSHLTSWVPEQIARNFTEAELATTPLFSLLQRSGVKLGTAHQWVSATLASPDVADALGLSVGAPLLSLVRVVRDTEGNGVEYLSALHRPDMFRLEMSLSLVGSGDSQRWDPVARPIDKPAAKPSAR